MSGHLSYRIGFCSDVGRKRRDNQDAVRVHRLGTEAWMVVVADGLGGCPAGDVAANMAANLLVSRSARWGTLYAPKDVARNLRAGLLEAHSCLLSEGERNAEWHGMGTTVVCVVLLPTAAVLAYSGDSSLLWVRSGRLHYRTRPHRSRHLLTSCLGGAQTPVVDPPPGQEILVVRAYDKLVLCSDGLENMVAEEKILQILSGGDKAVQEEADRLLQAALDAGGEDNVTVAVVHVTD